MRLVEGNREGRPINTAEPVPEDNGVPVAPDDLEPLAIEFWERTAPMLHTMGVLTSADVGAFTRLCNCYAELASLDKDVKQFGYVYETTSVTGERIIKGNPAVAQRSAADNRFRALLGEFGMTPASRSKIVVAPPADAKQKDPMGEFFGAANG